MSKAKKSDYDRLKDQIKIISGELKPKLIEKLKKEFSEKLKGI